MARHSTMKRVLAGKARGRETGYLVTWDVDSGDRVTCTRLRRFVFGDSSRSNGKIYRYPGFLELDGVRYLGQSVVFVRPERLSEIVNFLARNRVDHELTPAAIG